VQQTPSEANSHSAGHKIPHPSFMEPEGLLPYSQPYPEAHESSTSPYNPRMCNINFKIPLSSTLMSSLHTFDLAFCKSSTFYGPIHATCPAYLIRLNVIRLNDG